MATCRPSGEKVVPSGLRIASGPERITAGVPGAAVRGVHDEPFATQRGRLGRLARFDVDESDPGLAQAVDGPAAWSRYHAAVVEAGRLDLRKAVSGSWRPDGEMGVGGGGVRRTVEMSIRSLGFK